MKGHHKVSEEPVVRERYLNDVWYLRRPASMDDYQLSPRRKTELVVPFSALQSQIQSTLIRSIFIPATLHVVNTSEIGCSKYKKYLGSESAAVRSCN